LRDRQVPNPEFRTIQRASSRAPRGMKPAGTAAVFTNISMALLCGHVGLQRFAMFFFVGMVFVFLEDHVGMNKAACAQQ